MTNGYGNEYTEQGRRFLAQAWNELEADDLHQASEKGWGAAAQLVKAAAEERGLQNETHGHLFNVVGRLVEEANDDSLGLFFRSASALHVNFYQGGMPKRDIQVALRDVEAFVDRVSALLNGNTARADS